MLQKTASRSIPTNTRLLTAQNLSILALFSLIYFATVLLRASEKYFWFDELGTVNISRLPNMNAVWQTIRHGMDYNPPLFWVLTRLAGAPFGFGLISARLPDMTHWKQPAEIRMTEASPAQIGAMVVPV